MPLSMGFSYCGIVLMTSLKARLDLGITRVAPLKFFNKGRLLDSIEGYTDGIKLQTEDERTK